MATANENHGKKSLSQHAAKLGMPLPKVKDITTELKVTEVVTTNKALHHRNHLLELFVQFIVQLEQYDLKLEHLVSYIEELNSGIRVGPVESFSLLLELYADAPTSEIMADLQHYSVRHVNDKDRSSVAHIAMMQEQKEFTDTLFNTMCIPYLQQQLEAGELEQSRYKNEESRMRCACVLLTNNPYTMYQALQMHSNGTGLRDICMKVFPQAANRTRQVTEGNLSNVITLMCALKFMIKHENRQRAELTPEGIALMESMTIKGWSYFRSLKQNARTVN